MDYIYSSEIYRAQQTAEIISQNIGVEVNISKYFNELNVGDLEGKPIKGLNMISFISILDKWKKGKMNKSFRNGESMSDLIQRMYLGLKKIIQTDDNLNIIIVSHGGIISAALPYLSKNINEKDFYTLKNMDVKNCSISIFNLSNENCELILNLVEWNNCDHLKY